MGKQLSKVTPKEEQDEWVAYADALIESISEGYLDSHLKQIAKAAYDRAKSLGETPAASKPAAPALTTVSATGEWFPVKAVPRTTDDTLIEYKGNTYRRRDFIGKEFVVRPGTYKNPAWNNQRVRITGAGAKSFKVKFLSGQGPTGPSGLSDGEVCFIFHERAHYLFDGEDA